MIKGAEINIIKGAKNIIKGAKKHNILTETEGRIYV